MYASLFLNFPLARQVVGFFYLTFIPGFLLVKTLKLESLNTLESILLSVGFSVAFLMIAGLVINQFGPLAGLSLPLAVLPLSLFINTLIIVAAAVAYLRQDRSKPWFMTQKISFHPATLLLVLIPVLSVVGAYLMNTTGNNIILIITILSIAALIVFTAFFEKPAKFYPFAILMIAIALLLHVSLMSNYLLPYGSDSPAEFYTFQTVQHSAQWNQLFRYPWDEGFGRYNAMLSITILPTVYSNMLGTDPTWVFKLFYPLIFALVPVALYLLWQPYIGKKLGFLAAFLFMAQSTFFTEMTALNRQMIGELFFVLLLFVLLNKKIRLESKFVAFGILSFGLIVSHYALAEIFLFFIAAAWVFTVFYQKRPSFNLQLSFVVFFFVLMFGWYIYTSGAVVFDSFMTFTGYVTSQLGDFFNPASRGQAVLTGLGLAESPSILNTVSRGFAYLTQLFILIGVLALITKKTKFKFDREFTVFSLIAVIFLIALTLVPGLANTLSMTRFYHILLMILAPFFIIGVVALTDLIVKNHKVALSSLLIVVVLVPYFLFQTNLAYEVAQGDSWSVPLSKERMSPMRLYGEFGYIEDFSVRSAQWLAAYTPYENNTVADNALFTALTAYGLVYRGYARELRGDTVIAPGEIVYLSYISINYANLIENNTVPLVLNQTNVIYSNGGSEVRSGRGE